MHWRKIRKILKTKKVVKAGIAELLMYTELASYACTFVCYIQGRNSLTVKLDILNLRLIRIIRSLPYDVKLLHENVNSKAILKMDGTLKYIKLLLENVNSQAKLKRD